MDDELRSHIEFRDSEEEGFRVLVEAVKDYAIFMLDVEGRIMSWNRGAQLMKGYRADEIVGESFSRFYTDADRQAGRPSRLHRAAPATARHHARFVDGRPSCRFAQPVVRAACLAWRGTRIHSSMEMIRQHP